MGGKDERPAETGRSLVGIPENWSALLPIVPTIGTSDTTSSLHTFGSNVKCSIASVWT